MLGNELEWDGDRIAANWQLMDQQFFQTKNGEKATSVLQDQIGLFGAQNPGRNEAGGHVGTALEC